MNLPTQPVEEWISTQSEVARTTLAKAIAGAWTLALPLLLSLSGLSTANKILGSVLWVSATLNLFLLVRVCWHRTQNRRRLADQPKKPELPVLDGFDLSVLIRLVAYDLACGVRRLAGDMKTESFKISYSMDKLAAWDYVVQTRPDTLSGAEYKVTPKGRARAVDPKNNRSEQGVGEQPAKSTSIS
jgi:hypothetical protein